MADCAIPGRRNRNMRVVEIVSHGATIVLDGNLLRINLRGERLGALPIRDLDIVVMQIPAVAITGAALAALAEAGVMLMACDERHLPVAWLHPLTAAKVFDPLRARRQAGMTERARARLWRDLVTAKIMAQADLLRDNGKPDAPLRNLALAVAPGDPGNLEAQAAQKYWPSLFGEGFRRRGETPVVQALDWGYAVLRGIVARALVAAGLYPAIGLHHIAAGNAYNLADDLIEPYRPIVDRRVAGIFRNEDAPMAKWKADLAQCGDHPVESAGRALRARSAIGESVASLVRIVDSGKGRLQLPDAILEERHASRLAPDVASGLL